MSVSLKHNLAEVRYIVAIAAGKGGVGKSTLSLNLALLFQKMGCKVGVMDADLYGPSLRRMLPEQCLPSQGQHGGVDRIIPAECYGGIKAISMAYFIAEDNPASVRAPIANGVIKQFIHCVDWGKLDFLFIDFPPGTGDIQLTLIQECNLSGVIIVTTPQEIALLDVAKANLMFQQMQVPVIGVVENMSYYLTETGEKNYFFGRGGGERFALQNGLFFLGQIPIDSEISRCCDEGKSLFENDSKSISVQAFTQVSHKVKEQLEAFAKLSAHNLKNLDLQWK